MKLTLNPSMLKFWGTLAVIVVLIIGGAIWKSRHDRGQASDSNHTITVTTSFYPLAEFAQKVGGDHVTVINITPAGSEPHDFEPSPQDIATVQNSKVFIYNGAGLEGWVDKVLPGLTFRGVTAVKASDNITLLAGTPENSDTVQIAPDAKLSDPHIWLDPALAKQEVATIRDALIKADPAHKDAYQTNADNYTKELSALDVIFTQGLKTCDQTSIVTSHAAFAYLAKHYGLTMIPIAGLSPDSEPSPQRLANIAQFVKDNHITYIFFESLVSPKLSQTIAQETGAKTIAFNPLEGLTKDELSQGLNYIAVQQQNLANLKRALSCH